MQKNTAGKWIVFAFEDEGGTNPGEPVTGDAANITANIRIDGGAANAVDDTNPTELEDGYYVFDITATEANGDLLCICPASSTANVNVIGVPGAVWTTPANFNDMALTASTGRVDINTNNDKTGYSISGTITTLDGLNDPDVNEIADQVWDEQTSGHIGAGSFGAQVKTSIDNIETDTGSLNDTKIPDTLSLANINTQVDTALTDIGLDHLVSASVVGTDIVDNSIVAKLVSSSATADWDSYVNTTDSLQAQADALAVVDSTADAILVDTGTTLDGKLTTVESKIDTVDGVADAILVDTGTTLPATLTTIEGKVDAVDTVVDAVLVDTDSTLNTVVNSIESKVDIIDTNVDAILVDTNEIQGDLTNGGRLDLIFDAIKAVTDNIPASGALNNLSAADINAEVLDVLNTDTFAELGSVPGAGTTLTNMIRFIYLMNRNKLTQTSTTKTLRNNADNADIGSATVSDDGTTATRGKFA